MTSMEITKGRRLNSSQPIGEEISFILRRGGRGFVGMIDAVLDYLQDQRDLSALDRMSDTDLKDIGLTRSALGGGTAERGAFW